MCIKLMIKTNLYYDARSEKQKNKILEFVLYYGIFKRQFRNNARN
jgi:hypothetical protein